MARRAIIGIGDHMNQRTNWTAKEPFPSNAASRRHPAGVWECPQASTRSRCPQRTSVPTRTAGRHQPLPGTRAPHRHGRIRGCPSKRHRSHSVRMIGKLAPEAGHPSPTATTPMDSGRTGRSPKITAIRSPEPRSRHHPRGHRAHTPGKHRRPLPRLPRPTDTVPLRTPPFRIADPEDPPCPR